MPKLSKNGQSLVAKAQYKRTIEGDGPIDRPGRLSIEASRVILEEVLDDIQFQGSIELEKVIKDQRLRLTRETEKDATKRFNREELHNLLETRLVGNGVSEDNARYFLKGKNIGEDACKYFCKALGIPYFEAIEGGCQLKIIEKVATKFNHTEQFSQFYQLLQTPEKRIQLFCNVTHYQEYLQLKWLLLRCFNQSCNLNNSETLSIKFQRNLSKPISEPLNFLQTKLIQQINNEIRNSLVKIPPDEMLNQALSTWSDIAKFLRKRILFKKNVILVFYLKYWDQNTIKSFWDELIKFLPRARDGEHYLSLLVINDNQTSFNLPNFHAITIQSSFEQKEILDCLRMQNSQEKETLKLLDDNLKITAQNIWKNSNQGEPETLLQAIYEQFDNDWYAEKEEWYSLKS